MSRRVSRRTIALSVGVMSLWAARATSAHSGPPFPIVSTRIAGPYEVSVWADPDTTDDGSAGGQFWVTVRLPTGEPAPAETRVDVAIAPLDRPGAGSATAAAPVPNDPSQRFAALVMDHEGRFRVRVTFDGPPGRAEVAADVDATYDLRPSASTIALVLMPFALIGVLWIKAMRRGRRRPAGTSR